jgi:alpha-1,2-glucosyltransferase
MIITGDKSNHVPALHVPQLYYFVTTATFFGWPALLSGSQGTRKLTQGVWKRMFGGKMLVSISVSSRRLLLKKSIASGVHQ